MGIWWIIIELLLGVFAGWTLAYHFALLVNLPARLTVIPFLAVVILFIASSAKRWSRAIKYVSENEEGVLFGAAALFLTVAVLVLVQLLPNADDVFIEFSGNMPGVLTARCFFFVPLIAVGLRKWRRRSANRCALTDEEWAVFGIAALALLVGVFCMLQWRPDADDFSFFRRAAVQLEHLELPFIRLDTSHNVPGLPPISQLHILTSYEPLVAMGAHAVGVDPLRIYQNVSALVVGVLLPIIYVLLYRKFRLDRTQALLASSFAIAFLLLDGNVHRSFGNITLVRFWQGKTILWGLLLPMIFLLALRFLSRPTFAGFCLVAMAGICAVGLSGSGVFLMPVFVFALSVAHLLSYGFSRPRLKRALMLNLASFYCAVVAVGLFTGLIPQPAETTAWDIWAPGWWQNLNLVIDGSLASLGRDLVILLIVPIVALVKPLNRFPVILSVVLCLMFANPLLGPVWVEVLHSASYWRLAYLFPMPWCAGLVACLITRLSLRDMQARLRAATAAIAILMVAVAFQTPVLQGLRTPWTYQFGSQELAFSRSVSGQLQGKSVLAPQDVVIVMGLLDPSITFESTRRAQTLHAFRNVGQVDEGVRRSDAQELVYKCVRSPERDEALLRSCQGSVDAVVVRECQAEHLAALVELLASAPGQWEEVERNNGYILFMRSRDVVTGERDGE
jgi:hypothetical protein